jgi:hypothetical protein
MMLEKSRLVIPVYYRNLRRKVSVLEAQAVISPEDAPRLERQAEEMRSLLHEMETPLTRRWQVVGDQT